MFAFLCKSTGYKSVLILGSKMCLAKCLSSDLHVHETELLVIICCHVVAVKVISLAVFIPTISEWEILHSPASSSEFAGIMIPSN